MGSPAAAAWPLRLPALLPRTLRPPRAAPLLRPSGGASGASACRRLNVQAATTEAKLKSIDDLPGPSLTTSLYWLLVKGYSEKTHLLQGIQKNLYGPIWRSRFGPLDLVNVASPDLIAQVIHQEGRYPVRAELPHWKEYRDLRGQAYGLHVDTGPEWYRIRSVLNPKMLKPREVMSFAPVIHQVVSDLLQRIELLRCRSPDQATIPDLASEFYKFGFEGISAVLFETRLGCLQEEIPHDTLRFIAAVNDMLSLSDTVLLLPRWSRDVFPFWRRFVQAWDDLYNVARTLIDRRVAEMEAQAVDGDAAEGMYLTYLLASDKLSRDEVYISVTELMLGGVDTETLLLSDSALAGGHQNLQQQIQAIAEPVWLHSQTSNTLSWALYHLSRDSRVQDLLHRELNTVCPDKRQPTTDDLSRMPYLKAVIKETLRLYPVVPGNGRFISENEVIVDNYWFPKKTQFHLCHYAACHDESEFVDAELFIPERWLRADPPASRCGRTWPGFYQHHPYSFIPFGVGVRACVGKRLAEMEMYFALSRLIQNYRVQPEDGSPTVEAKTRTLMIPASPINLRFHPRT